MKEGEEYFKETIHHNFPTHAMIIKGHWVELGYGNVWCKIDEAINHLSEFSLEHPEMGGFAWVDKSECKFGVKKIFRTTK
jgi:hypothetical protein